MANDQTASSRLKRKDYEKELRKLQVQLCHLQEWVKEKKLRVIILFEGMRIPTKSPGYNGMMSPGIPE